MAFAQQQYFDDDSEHGQHPDDIPRGQDARSSQSPPQAQNVRPQLDYEPPALFDKNYADLEAESFDHDPNATKLKLELDEEADLTKNLKTVAGYPEQAQSEFLASLPIDEWEQTGEWFMTQFAGLMNKLKDARQEKRTIAKEFEDEIEQRHTAVTKKRKQTEQALDEMKESGGKVLQGTPKKSKTKK